MTKKRSQSPRRQKYITKSESGPEKKKQFGQHFLRKQSVVDNMINKVKINPQTYVLEIGCGDGFLTQSILAQTNCKALWSYEIDNEWADVVERNIHDFRLRVRRENILEADFSDLEKHKPWVILANLPYQITFPILFLFQKHKHLFNEGVVMVQEEVAQKFVAKKGRSYNPTSMFLQQHFDFELLDKIEPQAFEPAPKVFSRLVYFKPKEKTFKIKHEEAFWKFLKLCFIYPRRTLQNNLRTTHYDLSKISEKVLSGRAQELSFNDFVKLWETLNK